MRARLMLAIMALVAASGAPLRMAHAADAQGTQQIIQQLTPTPGASMNTTRGIRLGGAAPAGKSGATPGVAEVSLSVPFASGSAAISPAAVQILNRLGEALASPQLAAFKFQIEGHTDTTGSADVNKTLSEARAQAVTDYLATKFAIDRARMTPVGMGEDGLAVETGPGVANAANRRVRVVNLGS